jgi:hypothetical protein
MVWDSGMTERDGNAILIFVKQAVLGGHRVPYIAGVPSKYTSWWYEQTGLHSEEVGVGMPETTDLEQAKTLPFLARYIRCSPETQEMCNQEKYRAVCWIEREDFQPSVAQAGHPGMSVGVFNLFFNECSH